jgi:hypothetical protein
LRTPGTIAFIDEFGTNSFSFDKPDVSTHFIITCIIVEKSKEYSIKGELEKIRQILHIKDE